MPIKQIPATFLRVDDSVEILELDLPFVLGETPLSLLNKSGLKICADTHPDLGLWVVEIAGAENELAGGFNWTCRVIGNLIDCPCDQFQLEPGDEVEFLYVGDVPILRMSIAHVPHMIAVLELIVEEACRGGLVSERAEAAYQEILGGLRGAPMSGADSLLAKLKNAIEAAVDDPMRV